MVDGRRWMVKSRVGSLSCPTPLSCRSQKQRWAGVQIAALDKLSWPFSINHQPSTHSPQ